MEERPCKTHGLFLFQVRDIYRVFYERMATDMRILNRDGMPAIENLDTQGFLDELEGEYHGIIASGGEVLLKDIYNRLGLPFPEEPTYSDLALWGWDKKGFRQLYRIETKRVRCE